MPLIPSLIFLALANSFASGFPSLRLAEKSSSMFSTSLPLTRRGHTGLSKRQGGESGAIGLGDARDNVYSVQVTVNSVSVPVLFDTGSSDLWTIGSDCTPSSCGSSSASTPQISASSLKSSGIDIEFHYGDSAHSTFASGTIGSGNVGVAGLQLADQFLAVVDHKNISFLGENISGIFGVGFPHPPAGSSILEKFLDKTLASTGTPNHLGNVEFTNAFIESLSTQGPLLSRMVANHQLAQPMFTVTLEREEIEVGGNVGQLTIGKLPDGVSNDSLTWVPVRLYTPEQGGLAGSTANPNEVYPLRWEIPIDDVLLNGKILPKPNVNGVGYTALVDSGTSFLAGPQGVVASIYDAIGVPGSSRPSSTPTISCTTPVDLVFVIGGKKFPVDPRDFLSQQVDVRECNARYLMPTDPPDKDALISWILGDPFMKSNLVAFYYGNLTSPSTDPPRMGFLSTVPNDSNDRLKADIKSAQAAGKFTDNSVSAPTTPFSPPSTGSNGVGQAPTGVVSRKKGNALSLQARSAIIMIIVMSTSAFLL